MLGDKQILVAYRLFESQNENWVSLFEGDVQNWTYATSRS